MAIKNAAAKLLQGKTFVDLVQAFVLDPLNEQREKKKPKLDLGAKFSAEIKERLRDIGYDIHHIATTPKAKLVEFIIQSPYVTLPQQRYQLKGGSGVVVDIGFNGNLTHLEAVRGRMTLETDPAAEMQADLPSVAQAVLSGVTPFVYDAGVPLDDSETGENWLSLLRTRLTKRLNDKYGFSIHNLQINPRESDPRAYLRRLQAGGAHSFVIENYSPGDDGQSRGLSLRVSYSIREPRLGEGGDWANPLAIYERYIEANLHTLDPEPVHGRVQAAVSGELNEVFNQLSRETIQTILVEGKHSRNANERRQYDALTRRVRGFVAANFGLLIDLSISIVSADPQGLVRIILQSDADELGARLKVESRLRIARAEAAEAAWNRYYEEKNKFDLETASEGEKKQLEELKRAAEELEDAAEMGKRPHISHQLRSAAKPSGSSNAARVLGLEDNASLLGGEPERAPGADKVVDIEIEQAGAASRRR